MSDATIAESIPLPSILTVPQAPKRAAPTPREKSGLLIGLVVVVVILSFAGVGGLLLFKWSKAKAGTGSTATGRSSSAPVTAPKEISRYWLELEKPSAKVAGLVPIASGQSLKMHFVFSEDGYVYIVGLGSGNQPVAFLTSKPAAMSGLETNRTQQNADLSFPRGDGNWLTLDNKPGTENYTIVFSKTPLAAPAFFNAPAAEKALTSAEQSEFKDFIASYKAKPPTTELDESNSTSPFVRVKVLPDQAGNPIVFDVRIQHK